MARCGGCQQRQTYINETVQAVRRRDMAAARVHFKSLANSAYNDVQAFALNRLERMEDGLRRKNENASDKR